MLYVTAVLPFVQVAEAVIGMMSLMPISMSARPPVCPVMDGGDSCGV